MTSFRSLIRKGDKLWYHDQQVEVVSLDGPDVTVKFFNSGKEDTTHFSNLETRQRPPVRKANVRPSWLSVVKTLKD